MRSLCVKHAAPQDDPACACMGRYCFRMAETLVSKSRSDDDDAPSVNPLRWAQSLEGQDPEAKMAEAKSKNIAAKAAMGTMPVGETDTKTALAPVD